MDARRTLVNRIGMTGLSGAALLLASCSMSSQASRDPAPEPTSSDATASSNPNQPPAPGPLAVLNPMNSIPSPAVIDARAVGLGVIPVTGGDQDSTRVSPFNVAQVTFVGEGSAFDPTLTPDGKTLVFAGTQHRPTSDLYSKPVDGRVVTQLTSASGDDAMPSVSPDGTRLAFASNRSGNWDIFVMPVSGGPAVQVTTDSGDELHPSWSPDGAKLVFSRLGAASGRWEMWVTEPGNNAVSHFIGYGLFPSWSPVAATGAGGTDKILFQLARQRGQRSFGVWTLDYKDGQTSNLTEIAASPTTACINPTWSPDAQKVVYSQIPLDASLGDHDVKSALNLSRPNVATLKLVNVDGTGEVDLTGSGGSSILPFWGRSGRVVFVANFDGTENIWSIDMKPAVLAQGGQASDMETTVTSAPSEESTGEEESGN
jgi:TolB protein